MDLSIILANLYNPTILYFILGIIATIVKSDLEIPKSTSKFLSLYLLFSIGFKGGQELTHSPFTTEILFTLLFGVLTAFIIPLYSFFILKKKFNISDSGAIAASYGSVSAVTFVAAASFLEMQNLDFGGHMVAVMALMESPAIVMGVVLLMHYDKSSNTNQNLSTIIKHSFTNGSVLMILGSLVIGIIADSKQAAGISPFTTDIFKGFLALFLLEMGMITARKFAAFKQYGRFAFLFAIVVPIINGCIVAIVSGFFIEGIGNRFMLTILCASASYIAVPAAMRIAAPKSNPGLYIPMALGITFPFNITFGMPLYFGLIQYF